MVCSYPYLVAVWIRNLFYFEHRRDRHGNTISGRGLEALEEQEREVPIAHDEENKQPAREIVGYGEDGKAIYADGSTGDEDVGEHGRAASFTVRIALQVQYPQHLNLAFDTGRRRHV